MNSLRCSLLDYIKRHYVLFILDALFFVALWLWVVVVLLAYFSKTVLSWMTWRISDDHAAVCSCVVIGDGAGVQSSIWGVLLRTIIRLAPRKTLFHTARGLHGARMCRWYVPQTLRWRFKHGTSLNLDLYTFYYRWRAPEGKRELQLYDTDVIISHSTIHCNELVANDQLMFSRLRL